MASYLSELRDQEVLDYIDNTIDLLSKLCLGRNKKAIAQISEIFSFDLVLTILRMEKLPPLFLSNMIRLLTNLYVDCDPYQPVLAIKLTRKWDEVQSNPKEYNLEAKGLEQSFTQLKALILEYLNVQQSLNANEFDKNQLTCSVRYFLYFPYSKTGRLNK